MVSMAKKKKKRPDFEKQLRLVKKDIMTPADIGARLKKEKKKKKR